MVAISVSLSVVFFVLISVFVHHWLARRRVAQTAVVPGAYAPGANVHTLGTQPQTVGKPLYTPSP